MLITSYYKFARKADSKTKTRIDCIASTQDYSPLEALRSKKNGLLSLYVTENRSRKAKDRGATLALSKTESITSLFEHEKNCSIWHGDIKKTKDCLIISHNDVYAPDGETLNDDLIIEVYVFRGQKAHVQNLCNLFIDGELDEEIGNIKLISKDEKPIILFG